MKVHYHHQLVKKMLLSMEAGEDLKISVLDAMQRLKIYWDKVTSTTIQNCSHHCNFFLGADTVGNLQNDSDSELKSVFEELKGHEVNVEGSFEDYPRIDEDIPVSGILSDNEYAATIQGEVFEPYVL